MLPTDNVVWEKEIDWEDRKGVGLVSASLGQIAHHNVPIRQAIVVTQHSFKQFLEENNLTQQISHLLGSLNPERQDSLRQISLYTKDLILKGLISKDIQKPLFSYLEKLGSKKVTLEAYYFQGEREILGKVYEDLQGESVIAETLRKAWAHLFSSANLKNLVIHHKNHHNFGVSVRLVPLIEFELNGCVRTYGKSKADYEIEAFEHVKYVYNKHAKALTSGESFEGGNKQILSVHDIKQLLSFAKSTEDAFYLPQTLYWGKIKGTFLVTKIIPSTEAIDYKDEIGEFVKTIGLTRGIAIGRLKVVDSRQKTIDIRNEEIVMIDKLDKHMLATVKAARGLIVGEKPNEEVVHALHTLGIPAVVRKNHKFLYSTGDVVTLNATTGEIKRGSILVS